MIIMCLIVVSPTVLASQSPVDVAKQEKQNIDKQYNPKGMIVTTEDGQILYNYHDKNKLIQLNNQIDDNEFNIR